MASARLGIAGGRLDIWGGGRVCGGTGSGLGALLLLLLICRSFERMAGKSAGLSKIHEGFPAGTNSGANSDTVETAAALWLLLLLLLFLL